MQTKPAIPLWSRSTVLRASLLSAALGLVACSDEAGPAGFTALVGPDGGVVSAEGLEVTFPPGAVADSTAVTIAKAVPGAFVAPALRKSDSFTVTIDGEVKKAVTLSTTLPSAPSSTLLAVVSGPTLPVDGATVTPQERPLYVGEARVSGNSASVSLFGGSALAPVAPRAGPPGAASAGLQEASPRRSFTLGFIDGLPAVSSDHFAIRFPETGCSAVAMREALVQAEKAWTLLTARLGFLPRAHLPGLSSPVMLYVVDGMPADRYGEAGYGSSVAFTGAWSLSININSRYCGALSAADARELRVTIGHELFHLFQHVYDPHWWITKSIGDLSAATQSQYAWFFEASSTWLEPLVLGDDTYAPAPMTQNAGFVRGGLEQGGLAGGALGIQGHGYGAAAFLTFLTDKYGEGAMLSIWDAIKGESVTATTPSQVMGRAGLHVGETWAGFAEKFVTGTTGKAGWLAPNFDSTFRYTSSTPEWQEDVELYPLSAYNLQLNFKSLTEPTVFSIQVSATSTLAAVYNGPTRLAAFTGELLLPVKPKDMLTLVLINADDKVSPFTPVKPHLTVRDAALLCNASYLLATYTKGSERCTGNCLLYTGLGEYFLGGFDTANHFEATVMGCPPAPASCRWKDFGTPYTNRLAFDSDALRTKARSPSLKIHVSNPPPVAVYEEGLVVTGDVPRTELRADGTLVFKLSGAAACTNVSVWPVALVAKSCDASSAFTMVCAPRKP